MRSDTNLEPALDPPVGDSLRPPDVARDGDDVRRFGDDWLVAAAHRGDEDAWRELVRRHRGVVTGVVGAQGFWWRKRVARSRFDHVAAEIRHTPEPTADDLGHEGSFAVRAFRPRVLAALTDNVYGPAEHAEIEAESEPSTELDRHEEEALADAYGSLPTPWQTVLWHHVIEQLPIADTAMFLGRPEYEVEPLAVTATNGLFHAYLRVLPEHSLIESQCAPVVPLLDGHYRETLGAADQRLVTEHLSGTSEVPPCTACRRRLMTAFDLSTALAPAVVPGVTGLDVARYQQLVAATGPAEMTTDGDRRRPFLIEAAVVALVAAAGFLLVARPFGTNDRAGSSAQPTSSIDAAADADAAGGSDDAAQSVRDDPDAPDDAVIEASTLPPLRPLPTGPRNVVELDFDSGSDSESADLVATPVPFTVELDAPGPVIAGGTGTIDVTITNPSEDEVRTEFVARLPAGVRLEAAGERDPAAGGDEVACSVPESEGFTTCAVALAPGAAEVATLRFGLESRIVGQFVVVPSVGDTLAVDIDVVQNLAANTVRHGELVMIGNTLITCDIAADGCTEARDLVGVDLNRFDFPLAYVDVDDDAATENSSTAQLELGDAGVARALLFWSGDVGVGEASAARSVRFVTPGFDPIEVTAEHFVLGDFDSSEYLAYADVSIVVAAAGTGEYGVADLTTSVVEGAYGGWSLVVITDDPAAPRRQFLVTRPFAWVAPDYDVDRALVVSPGESLSATVDVLGFEGEPGFAGERMTVAGEAIGGATGFDSSIDGERTPDWANNFGVDIDRYDVVLDADDGAVDLVARSGNDGVRLAVVALTVDIE